MLKIPDLLKIILVAVSAITGIYIAQENLKSLNTTNIISYKYIVITLLIGIAVGISGAIVSQRIKLQRLLSKHFWVYWLCFFFIIIFIVSIMAVIVGVDGRISHD